MEIRADTGISDLVERYPFLLETLNGYHSAFAKLRNPLLREPVTEVATVAIVADMAEVPLDEFVRILRDEVARHGETPAKGAEEVRMNSQEVATDLNMLRYVEQMGVQICREAAGVLAPDDAEHLRRMAGDHEDAADRLSDAIAETGEEPTKPPRELVDYMDERLQAVRARKERQARLADLRAYEREAALQYSESLQLQHPAEVMGLLRRNFDEERARLSAIEEIAAWTRA